MSIPLPETGPKVAPLIPDDEAINLSEPEKPVVTVELRDGKVVVDEESLKHIAEDKRDAFVAELKKLLEPQPQKYVLRGERSASRNKCAYPGYCNGTKEKTRRNNARLANLVKSEGC